MSARHATGFDPAALEYDADGLVPVVVQEVASSAVLMVAWADRAAVEKTLASGDAWFWSRSRREPWRKGATSGNTLSVAEVRADCDGDTLLYRVDAAGPACHTGARTCFDRAERITQGESGGRQEAEAGSAPLLELGWLWRVLEERRAASAAGDEGADESYTARLLAAGVDRVARKLGEEATETVIAALRASDAASGGAAPGGATTSGTVLAEPAPVHRTAAASTSPPAAAAAAPSAAPAPGSAAPAPGDAAAGEARAALAGEAADLLYHLLVLLMAAGASPADVAAELRRRHAAPRPPATPKPEERPA